MFFRHKTLLVHIVALAFAFILGCTITLSLVNIDKGCRSQPEYETTDATLSSNEIFLVILVLSAPKNVARRNVIRQTWLNLKPKIEESKKNSDDTTGFEYDARGFLLQDNMYRQMISLERFKKKITKTSLRPLLKDLNVNILHYFAIGTESLPFVETDSLTKEHAKYKDLLVLNNLSDSYSNLTQKLLQSLSAINNIQTFKYLLKVDDDTYVKLDYLLEDLYDYDDLISSKQFSLNFLKPELYWGYFNGRATIKTRGQWKEKHFNLCDRYLPYAIGGGYIISKDIVHYIARNQHSLNRYVSEDISMGVWLSSFRNIYRKHDVRFDTAYMPRKCRAYHIVLHKRSINDMKDLYRGQLCTFKLANDTSIQRPAEYYYDWDLPQTQCCNSFVE